MKTKKDLLKLSESLENGVKQGNTNFKYGIKKNIFIIQNEVESIKSAKYGEIPASEEIEQIRNELYQKYGEVDPTNPNMLIIPYFSKNEDGSVDNTKLSEKYLSYQKEFNERLKGIEDIIKEFNKKIENYELDIENYNKMLDKVIGQEFDFFEINIIDVPDSFLDLDLLMDFNIVK